jgi:hypothetical protein
MVEMRMDALIDGRIYEMKRRVGDLRLIYSKARSDV